MRSIKDTLAAFSRRDLQTFKNIIRTIEGSYTLEEVLAYIENPPEPEEPIEVEPEPEYSKGVKVKVKKPKQKFKYVCPECNKPSVFLRRLPKQSKKINFKGYTVNAVCLSETCNYDEYSKLPMQEFLNERIRKHI